MEKDIIFDEFKNRLEQVKKRFSNRQYQIFELNWGKGLSVSVIAKQLGITEKTVRNQLILIKQALRIELSYY